MRLNLLGFLFATLSLALSTAARAQTVTLSDLIVSSISPTVAEIAWEVSGDSVPGLDLFSDPAGTTSLAGQFSIEFLPVAIGDRRVENLPSRRDARRALQGEIRSQRLVLVRISGLQPQTTYYFRPRSSAVAGGPSNLVSPQPLRSFAPPSVTRFVTDARLLVVDFGEVADPTGLLAVLEGPAGTTPLLAVVGDAPQPTQAVFSLASIVDSALGSNAGFSGPIEFSIRLMGASAPEETTLYSLVFAPSVLVAGRSNTTFAGATQPAAFAIDAIPDQNAGLAFTVTVRALRAGGQPLATFSGTAVLSGVDVGGGTTPAFVNGVLASQIVMIREQGPASVTVTRGAASGVSNTFSVKGSFSAWRNTRFSESELANPAVSGPAADPGGRGVANLLRYAFNTGMNPPDLSRLPRFGGVTIGGSTFLTISFNRSATADDLEYVVQASGNMQTWQDVQTFTAGLPEVVTVQDTVAVTVATPRYLRVLVRQRPSFGDAAFASLPSNLRMDPSATQPFADYGSRGISNFERYAYGLDFLNPSVSQLPAASIVTKAGGARHLAVTFRRRTEAGASVRYLVQTSTNFGPWSTVATIAPGSPSPVTVEDPVALASQPKFIRVQVVPGTP